MKPFGMADNCATCANNAKSPRVEPCTTCIKEAVAENPFPKYEKKQ